MPVLDTIVVEVIERGPQGPQVSDGDKGDITVSSNGTNWQINAGAVGTTELAAEAVETAKIADKAITNAKLADMDANTFKTGPASGSGAPVDTPAEDAGLILQITRSFETRAAAIAAIAGGWALEDGQVFAAAGLFYVWQAGATAIPDMPDILPAGDAWVEHFGAAGDGATDDTAALQAALDYGKTKLRARRYRTTADLVFSKGSGFTGQSFYFTQFLVNWPTSGVSEIFYDGPADAMAAIVRVSAAAVGTLPTFSPTETTNLTDCYIDCVVLNGNDKAGYGLYSARAGFSIYQNIVVGRTTVRGFFFAEFWSSRVRNLLACHNRGTGFSIGEVRFGWSDNVINAVSFDTLVAFKNGRAEEYNQTTAPREGVGFVIRLNRTCNIRNIIAELNYGAGIYLTSRTGPSEIEGLYLEDNCHYDPVADLVSNTRSAFVDGRCTKPWGLVAHTVANTLIQKITNVICAAPTAIFTRYQFIRLTADISGGLAVEPLEPWVFDGIWGARGIESQVYGYKIENTQTGLIQYSPGEPDITGCMPKFGRTESVGGSLATLHVGMTATGDKSGVDASNLIAWVDAVEVARVCRGVTTLNISAMTATSPAPSATRTLDMTGWTRSITIEGGTTGRFLADSANFIGLLVKSAVAGLLLKDLLAIDRVVIEGGFVNLQNCPLIRCGANAKEDAAVVADKGASVCLTGTSVINASNSTASTRRGLRVSGQSSVSFPDAAAGTITSATSGYHIVFTAGGGSVFVSVPAATATWAGSAQVNRGTGGGAGVIIAAGVVNP